MTVTANSVITAQSVQTAQATCTAAKTTYADATNAVLLLTAGPNGGVLYGMTARPKGTTGGAGRVDVFASLNGTTLAFIKAGYNVAFEPVEARPRLGSSKIRVARDGAKFLMIILKIVTIFSPLRIFVPIAAVTFLLGAAYGVWNVVVQSRIPNGAVLLILFSVVVFLVGLVSEQISALRFEGLQ